MCYIFQNYSLYQTKYSEGVYVARSIGSISSIATKGKAFDEDKKTLESFGFEIGDFLDVTIHPT